MKTLFLQLAKDYPVSLGVCLICIFVYLFGYVLPVTNIYYLLNFSGEMETLQHQPHRYFTPMFLHFHLLHIGFNLAIWWFFSRQLEHAFGGAFVILLTLFIAFISNFAQFFAAGPNFGGLSGVDFGLVGYIWATNYFTKKQSYVMPPGIMMQVLVLLVLGFSGVLDRLIGPIANMAHLAGLLAGFFAALLMNFKYLCITKQNKEPS